MRKLTQTLLFLALTTGLVKAGGIREHTRPDYQRDTIISKTQAVELTLTLVETAIQSLQTWVRTVATIDDSRKILSALLCSGNIGLIQLGQRVRAFPADSKSSVYQARVSRIIVNKNCATIEAILSTATYEKNTNYVMEIVVQRGRFLAIPKEAIIEEGNWQIVYLQQHPGHYVPKTIRTGIKGELYTEIIGGLNSGDQVVTLGSFFIDAEYKLKSTEEGRAGHAHQYH